MAKRLVAKTGEYTNKQTNETKGEYTKIGVILSGDNGEYMLLDPTVNLAGVLIKQNVYAMQQGKQQRESIMVSVFEDDNQQQGFQQGNGQNYQQPPQMNQNQPNPRNHGSQAPQNGRQNYQNDGQPAF